MRSGQGTDTYVDDTWYDAAGRVTLRELGSNYTLGQTYTYYPWTQQGGRLHSLQSGIPADQDSLQSLSYVYDEVGNVLNITDNNAGGTQIQTFTYDALDRLSSAVASGGTGGTYALKDYDYDTQGRLEINGTVINYYENTAHIHAVSKTSTGNTYSYDQNGNQTSRKVSGITYTLVYDAESRLVQIKRGSNIQATYTYDGDGNRVKTVVGNTTTTYIGNYLEWECTNTNCALKSYYYAAGQRVALRQGSGTLYFLLTDHLGSTAVTATSGGGLYGELRYYPWGGTRYDSGTTPTSYRYTGQREAEVGLYYYNARFYDVQLGRFISPDSIIPNPRDPISYDRFAYVRNNALRYSDPSGHWVCLQVTPSYGAMTEEDCPAGALDYGAARVPPMVDMYDSGFDYGQEHNDEDPDTKVYHPGIDVKSRTSTIIQSPGNGRIYFYTSQQQGKLTGFGYYAILEQSDGEGGYYYHILAHMASNNEFEFNQGAWIYAGTPIGIIGNTGGWEGIHLHWEIRNDPNFNPRQNGMVTTTGELMYGHKYYPSWTLLSKYWIDPNEYLP